MSEGLRIPRKLTEPGKDPYAAIEWSRRDSRITNPNGSVVFEMKNAEIPASWSQVATDIMVSKYFRKAGIPQIDAAGHPILDSDGEQLTGPETSARQVFDRLAETWRWWGETHGYFATATDAQSFEDELKYMLAAQIAAPNSPQWFNTGLGQKYGLTGPAQGMWYIDPATEQAVPSPDSYSRPAPHACFPAGTRISTRDGLKLIEKIEPGDEVLTHLGRFREVRDVMQRPVDEDLVWLRIAKLTASDMVATANHPVWAVRAGDATKARRGDSDLRPSWIPAGDLEPGDFVMVSAPQPAGVVHAGPNFEVIADTITTRNGIAYRVSEARREPFYGTVYNFSVEEDESYVANDVVVHNCFILSVKDDLVNPGGIMDLWLREARIFKFGSGAGSNFSSLRAENERLSGGGKSSGVMSFLKIGDRAAGAIKSGGTTRRAAKMVILDLDHPDIETFIDWKKHEEDKARILIRYGGYPADFNGEAYATVSGQNSNNSVRVPNEFIDALKRDGDWDLIERTTGQVRKTVKARDLWKRIADAAWACADPGVQYDTIINEWHTSPGGGKIRGTNPCFTGETRVVTDKGLIEFRDLVRRVADGETFAVYTHDATNGDSPTETISLTTPTQVMVTGTNQVLRVEFSDGRVLRLTPNHRVFTQNRGWVRADELAETDQVRLLDQPIDFGMASWSIPVSTDANSYVRWSTRRYPVILPEKWTDDLAHYLGWLVGDGTMTKDTAITVYGTAEEQQSAMLVHRELLASVNGGVAPKPAQMSNGTFQLRVTRQAIRAFLEALGVLPHKAAGKRVPWSIFQAPKAVVAAFLRGLFDADGCVRYGDDTRYVGLASASQALLREVQSLLDTFGVHGTIYRIRRPEKASFQYTTKAGESRTYHASDLYDLRVTGTDLERFYQTIGFGLSAKDDILHQVLVETTRYKTRHWVRMVARTSDGWETTYNLTEPRNHSYVAQGILVSNCAEFVYLDNTACNLASINLVKFLDQKTGAFDLDGYRHALRLWTIVLEISVTMAHFPSEEIAWGSYWYRPLGLGYANLGSLLMRSGIPYDSDEGRAIAGALTAILTGISYATSAEMAAAVGPFPKFAENREAMLRVMRNHRRAAYKAKASEYEEVSHFVMGIDANHCPPELLYAARESWDLAVERGERYGYRNGQASVLAPTGCLVGGSLVATDRGLVRLGGLGDPQGTQWQNLDVLVGTDHGAQSATQFYINGHEPVVTVETKRGYRVQGTPTHRVKVVDADGVWTWKRFADVSVDDLVPLQLNQLIGEPRQVALPPLGEMYWTGDFTTKVPRTVTAELAEFVGYFMGDGSLHSKGLRLCVTGGDFDVVERLSLLGKGLFNLEAHVTERKGYMEVAFHSVPLVMWWEACGFAKKAPTENHVGKGFHPHLPDALLATNDRGVYGAFIRGLFEADGYVHGAGYPTWSTTAIDFSHDVQSMLLALGFPTTRKFDVTGWGKSKLAVLRLANASYNRRWADEIGFLSDRKNGALRIAASQQSATRDRIPVPRQLIDRLVPTGDGQRRALLLSLGRHGLVSRRGAEQLYARTGDAELGHLLGFFYDRVSSAELGDEQPTYDLSVPANVTYIANGFVSHNTIGLLMDADTTGVEPDFSLIKFKKLAGGGYFKIVNQSVAPALERLGYSLRDVNETVEYVVGTNSFTGSPHINRESLREKGLTDEDINRVEKTLPGVFELKHAFNVFVVGEATLQHLGFEVDEYTSFEFDLLRALGFTREQIREATDHICGRQTVEGAPHLRSEHLPVFDTANKNGRYGQRFIHHTGHIKMLAATQPFLSGSASKTINLPNEATIEDIEESYMLAWELGVKCMALYRDGSKASQPLSSTSDDGTSDEESEKVTEALETQKAIHWGRIPAGISPSQAYAQGMPPPRFLLPARRAGWTQEARVGGHKVYLRTGEYADHSLGEIFIDLAKEGATLRGVLASFAIAVSKGLQYGVPLDEYVDTFTFQTFEPRGIVEGHPNIKMANSIIDYVFRAVAIEYLHRDDLAQVPPDRDDDLPGAPKGLAVEAGIQHELFDVAAEHDVEAVKRAASFADGRAVRPAAPKPAPSKPAPSKKSMALIADVSTQAMQTALSEMMGDAPLCDICGHITVRNGSCYKCLNCGNSIGCS